MKAALKYVGKSRYTLEDLKEIITILRAPDGCRGTASRITRASAAIFLRSATKR